MLVLTYCWSNRAKRAAVAWGSTPLLNKIPWAEETRFPGFPFICIVFEMMSPILPLLQGKTQ